ncbi:MAG: prenyltransferase [Myxococcota bacterium]
MLRAWFQAARPLAQANIAAPLILGQAAAYAVTGEFSWAWAAAAHGFGIIDQLVIIFWNDYSDVDADRLNDAPTPFSGGSRVIVEGKLSRQAVRTGAAIATAALLLFSGAVSLLGRPLTIGFALVGIGLVQLYSFAPARLAYRGHGEGLQALGLGIVLPALGYYLQAGELRSIPLGLLVGATLYGYAGNILTALPDATGDRKAGKRSFPVRYGERIARYAFVLITGAAAGAAASAMDGVAAAIVFLVPMSLVLAALPLVGRANAEHRKAVLWFVILGGGAIQGGILAWAGTLVFMGGT